MSSQLISLILFGIAASFSPGPNNIMTSYTAFNFGIKKTIPTMLGVIIGWTILVILLQIGSLIIFQKLEITQKVIRFFGSIYLLYMAYRISFSSLKSEKFSPKPVTFLNTFFFQFVNPKSIIIALAAISMFINPKRRFYKRLNNSNIYFFFNGYWKSSSMVFNGKIFEKKFATSDRFIKNFNYTMSFLLIVCVILFYV